MANFEYIDNGWEQQRRTGRFEIEPYSEHETEAWLQQVSPAAETVKPELDSDYERLESARFAASISGDYEQLLEIQAIARQLDGWDDTDPKYAHLIDRCSEDIKDIMLDFG